MFFGLFPIKTQWKKWHLPSKHTSLGLLLTLLFGLFGLPRLISWYKGSTSSSDPTPMFQEGTQNVQISGGSGGINIGRDLNVRFEGNQKDLVGEYLQQATNYKKAGNVDKTLEKALEALQINQNSLDAIYRVADAYTVKNDVESFKKARDLLDSKLNILSAKEKSHLGFLEYKLNNHKRSYQILKNINLYDINDELLPFVLVALVKVIFYTQPYNEDLYQIQSPLNFLQKRIAYLRPGVSKVSMDKIELEINNNYWLIRSSQLIIGEAWLVEAYNNEHTDDWIKAVNVATDGFLACCGVINKKEYILNYLSVFNEAVKNIIFLSSNTDTILRSITHYIEVLDGMSQTYQAEVIKLKILYNIIIETINTPKEKLNIYAKDDVEFILGISELSDNIAIKSVVLKKNFIISEDRNLLSGSHPRRVFPPQSIPLKVEKESTLSKDAVFAFNVIVEDTSSNSASGLLIPSLF